MKLILVQDINIHYCTHVFLVAKQLYKVPMSVCMYVCMYDLHETNKVGQIKWDTLYVKCEWGVGCPKKVKSAQILNPEV